MIDPRFAFGVLAILAAPASAAERPSLAVVGGTLIDGFGGAPLEDAVILIEGERIAAVGREGAVPVPADAEVIDANGRTVLPGLWESHGHLRIFGAGRPPEELETRFPGRVVEIMTAVAEINLLAGITSFRDLGGPLEQQRALRREIEAGNKKGPRLFLAGPTVRQRRDGETGSHPYAIASPEDARRVVADLAEQEVDQIWSEGSWDPELLQALAEAAHRAGLGIDLGVRHVAMMRIAIDAGVDRLHALFTADALSDYEEEDLRRLIRGEKPIALGPSGNILRGPYVAPSLEMREAYARAFRFPELLEHPRFQRQFAPDLYAYLSETWSSPQSIPWGIGSAERMEVARGKVRRFIEAGGREQLVAGTDAGSPLNFHPSVPREIANLVAAGLSPMEAIQSATLRPAQMQGADDRLGTVSAGKLADLIVVEGFPLEDIGVLQDEPVYVLKNGVRYR